MRRTDGVTLIELLMVVAIIGLIAAIEIPNLLNAIDRTKQKRTMADIRAIANAAEKYAVDYSYYPVSETLQPLASSPEVIRALQPRCHGAVPLKDGWLHDLYYQTAAGGTIYTIASPGKDGTMGAFAVEVTSDFDCEIVFSRGRFVEYPRGTRTD